MGVNVRRRLLVPALAIGLSASPVLASTASAGGHISTSVGFNGTSVTTDRDSGARRQTAQGGLFAGGAVLEGETVIVKYRKKTQGFWSVLGTRRPELDANNYFQASFGKVPAGGTCSLVARYDGDSTYEKSRTVTSFDCATGAADAGQR